MRAKTVDVTDDAGTRATLQILMTREITHMTAFTLALESQPRTRFMMGRIRPTPDLVDQFLNDSPGAGEDGKIDARGPSNEGSGWQRVEAPPFQDLPQSPSGGAEC